LKPRRGICDRFAGGKLSSRDLQRFFWIGDVPAIFGAGGWSLCNFLPYGSRGARLKSRPLATAPRRSGSPISSEVIVQRAGKDLSASYCLRR
jgi:hypothetical protein